jgi:hypothetical protein
MAWAMQHIHTSPSVGRPDMQVFVPGSTDSGPLVSCRSRSTWIHQLPVSLREAASHRLLSIKKEEEK